MGVRMRVLLVSHRFPPDGVAGVERVTQSLAAELARRAHPVAVFARRPTGAGEAPRLVRERLPDGASVYRLVAGAPPPDRFLRHSAHLERLFTSVLLESAPDVVHFQHLLGLSPRFLQMAHRHGAAVVLTLHDYYFACPRFILRQRSGEPCDGPQGGLRCARACFSGEGPSARLRWGLRATYFRRLLSIPDRITCPSRHVAAFFESYGAKAARTHVVPNGVALERPEWARPGTRVVPNGATLERPEGPNPAASRSGSELSLAFIGSVVRHKGVHVLLEALRRADLDRVELRVLGHAPDSGYVRELYRLAAAVPGLKFRLFGSYEQSRLACLLEGVDCVVVPSLWAETFSIVVREAYRCGIPVVASRIGALTEAVEEETNGLTFEVGRAERLSAILRRLVRDPTLLPRLREGALATRMLTPEEHAEATLAVYERAVRDRLEEPPRPALAEELDFLHGSLVGAGFGGRE